MLLKLSLELLQTIKLLFLWEELRLVGLLRRGEVAIGLVDSFSMTVNEVFDID